MSNKTHPQPAAAPMTAPAYQVTFPSVEDLGSNYLAALKVAATGLQSDCGSAARGFELERIDRICLLLRRHAETIASQHPAIRANSIALRGSLFLSLSELERLEPPLSDQMKQWEHREREKRTAALMGYGAGLATSATAPTVNVPVHIDAPIAVQPADVHVSTPPAPARPSRIESVREGDRTVMRPVYDEQPPTTEKGTA